MVTSRVASGVFVVEGTIGGWAIGRTFNFLRVVNLPLWLDGRRLFAFFLLFFRVLFIIFDAKLSKMLNGIVLDFRKCSVIHV